MVFTKPAKVMLIKKKQKQIASKFFMSKKLWRVNSMKVFAILMEIKVFEFFLSKVLDLVGKTQIFFLIKSFHYA